jgi:hypothetical protein
LVGTDSFRIFFLTPESFVFLQSRGCYVGKTEESSDALTKTRDLVGGTGAASRIFCRFFPKKCSGWIQLGGDIVDESSERFGDTVALSADGTIMAIGAISGDFSGYVRVFQFDNGTKSWIQLGRDIDGEDFFGISVALSADGSTVVIGAPQNFQNDNAGEGSGRVQIFKFANGSWSQIGGDIDDEATLDGFFLSTYVALSADGSIMAVASGLNVNIVSGFPDSRVRVFKFDSGSWIQLGLDIANEDFFTSVALSADGSIVAIGSFNGSSRIYKFDSVSKSWNQLGQDVGTKVEAYVLIDVALSANGSIMAVGVDPGFVQVFEFDGVSKSWNQLGQDVDSEFGASVDLSADGFIMAIGDPFYRQKIWGDYTGQVRVYKFDSGSKSWNQVDQDINGKFFVVVEGAADGVGFGKSVALSADGSIVAGAGGETGPVRVYKNGNL